MIRYQIFLALKVNFYLGFRGLALLMEGRPEIGEGSPNIWDFGIVTHIAILSWLQVIIT